MDDKAPEVSVGGLPQEDAEQPTIADRLRVMMSTCLFAADEIAGGLPPNAVVGVGLIQGYGFHPDRLALMTGEIRALLDEMPPPFHEVGGAKFTSLCRTKDGELWGEPPAMEALCCLAVAAGLGEWHRDPAGGVPFIQFNTKAQ